MATRKIGVIINGATGRIGTTQHLRHLVDMRDEGGLALRNGDRLVPDPLIVGRDAGRLEALAKANGALRFTTDLDAALAGPDEIFMDCAATGGRPLLVRRAIAAGKHVWAMRVHRDDTMSVEIDGTLGSAVAGRNRCFVQSDAATPDAFFGMALGKVDPKAQWTEVPDTRGYINPYRQCWESFLRHVAEDAPFVSTLLEGAKAVQLAELVYRSHAEGRWLDAEELRIPA